VGVVASHGSEISFLNSKDDFKNLERVSRSHPTIFTAFSYHVTAKLNSHNYTQNMYLFILKKNFEFLKEPFSEHVLKKKRK